VGESQLGAWTAASENTQPEADGRTAQTAAVENRTFPPAARRGPWC